MNYKNLGYLKAGPRCRQWIVDFAASIPGGSRIAKNADLNDKFAQFIALKSTITHMVPNFAANNPGAIAAWTSAAHVDAPPKTKPKPPTP